jgi:L-2-hydroxycarboxylate dehydrogenase (NAD+)
MVQLPPAAAETTTTCRVPSDVLAALLDDLFHALGIGAKDARLAADVLLTADLRGSASQGCARLPSMYAPLLRASVIRAEARPRIQRSYGALAVVDGDQGLGLSVGPKALSLAIRRANQFGVGLVWVVNCSHFGLAGFYTLKAAAAGMVGIALTNGSPAVAPLGACTPLLGTNAISLSCPNAAGDPLVADMAVSTVSLGRLEECAVHGQGEVPACWAADALQVQLQVSPEESLPAGQLHASRMLSVLGGGRGEEAEHKGYALGLMVEVLAGLVPGGKTSDELSFGQAGYLIGCIRTDAVCTAGEVPERLARMEQRLKKWPTLPGRSALRLPGARSGREQRQNLRTGVPLEAATAHALLALADDLGANDETVRAFRRCWPERSL